MFKITKPTAIFATLGALTGGALSAETEVKIGYALAPDSHYGVAAQKWQKVVEAETDGKFSFRHFPSSGLGGEREVVEGLQLGTVEATIVSLDSADITAADLTGSTARLTVRFGSQQMTVTRDENGETVEGEPESVVRVVDLWTFAHISRSSDPTWALVETRTPD